MFSVVNLRKNLAGVFLVICISLLLGTSHWGGRVLADEQDGPFKIFLTFDDGPSIVTPALLDVLAKHGVKGTFFTIVNDSDDALGVYQRIIAEGHSLGLHTYSHNTGKIYQSADAFIEDFNEQADFFKSNFGIEPKIYRFPGGSNTMHSNKKVIEEIEKRLSEKGYFWFDWDVPSNDSTPYTLPKEKIVHNILKGAEKKPNQDLILLFHDDSVRSSLPEAIDEIITYFKAKGYEFDTLKTGTEIHAPYIGYKKYQGENSNE